MTVTKHRTCANCGSRAVPIVYGLPTYDAVLEAEKGDFFLGGCEIFVDESPAWRCSNLTCGLEFGILRAS